jgi:hypothetical protein
MSIYVAALELAKNTTEANPAVASLPIFERYVVRCGILFPLNAARLVGVALYNQDMRFAPAPASQAAWIRDDGRMREWSQEMDLGGTPRVIRVQAINEDDTWTRRVEVFVETTDFPHWAQLMPRGAA